ncbi:MAG TPA: c-type cytochrome, partial [Thermoanaerobaculia bacterium]|nr:c-type cytochrome [Thermoanaerobaculia bacterium]
APGAERRRVVAVAAAAGVTLLVLVGFLLASVATGDRLAAPPSGEPLRVQVTGWQWWWDVRYPGAMAADEVRTANELHLPLGRPVRIELSSADVIHSFWVPRLHGKRDLLPGRPLLLHLTPSVAGVFDGQCAEMCGLQHAHMRLRVVVEPEEELEAWLAAQRRAAAPPASPLARRGQRVFLSSPCVLCHTVRGTAAGGRTGPDLTHLASRSTIAAGTLPNTRGHLAGWVIDSQSVKPGNAMPPIGLAGPELQALLAYLEGLE